uniref:SagB/ThcOx family dehydrogenase n=1 Tax=candidate division WOR-3 bacterium TaxID=2052148 RepID=A0A7C4GEU7_UNCW3
MSSRPCSLGLILVAVSVAGAGTLQLPTPDTSGTMTVEQALLRRRSVRSFSTAGLKLSESAQLLWAAQGKTSGWGGRVAPSAGGTYPMELYLVAGKVSGLEPGVYRYLPADHALETVKPGDVREKLASAALGQAAVASAPAVLVLACDYRRTTARYGERGVRYVHMEAGHVGQNVHLACEAMGLGTVMIGAFSDAGVKRALGIAYDPLYVMPVGRRKGG